MMLIAAALVPMMAMVGGGVDISRAYLAESRLQQACDAGVLAARKRLGSDLPPSSRVVGLVGVAGREFFDLNFPRGSFGSEYRNFEMTLEQDFAISGEAQIELPTAVMSIFGFDDMPIEVTCQARMNFSNLDVMMVLDTTGSMRHTNAGDDAPRIDVMRRTIRSFYRSVELTKAPGTRIRYGFVPYATNVNTAAILDDRWVARDWTYQSREDAGEVETTQNVIYKTDWTKVSGDRSPWTEIDAYSATPNGESSGTFKCDGSQPGGTVTWNDVYQSEDSTPVTNPDGTRTEKYYERTNNGTRYRTRLQGSRCIVEAQTDTNYVETFIEVTEPRLTTLDSYLYRPIARSTNRWRENASGCMEEQATYEVDDWDDVDLTRARDLDINLVPDRNRVDTQWKPRYPLSIYARSLNGSGQGPFTSDEVTSTDNFFMSGASWQSACPAPVRRLATITEDELDAYLGTLSPFGATYHDIGMLWGGRLLSQHGLFAAANADTSRNQPTSRHLIFLTDGQTEPYDVAYGPYGVEPLDQRRWNPDSSDSLAQTVENRFAFACQQVRNNNTTIWVIAFGTTLNPVMENCAGEGRYFEADDSDELGEAFKKIAESMGDLRISR